MQREWCSLGGKLFPYSNPARIFRVAMKSAQIRTNIRIVKIPARTLLEAEFAEFQNVVLANVAVRWRHFFTRQRIEHGFLSGASLFSEPSAGCEKFLEANQRARVQWKLEQEFAEFEQK